jgi:hypothetical protein
MDDFHRDSRSQGQPVAAVDNGEVALAARYWLVASERYFSALQF